MLVCCVCSQISLPYPADELQGNHAPPAMLLEDLRLRMLEALSPILKRFIWNRESFDLQSSLAAAPPWQKSNKHKRKTQRECSLEVGAYQENVHCRRFQQVLATSRPPCRLPASGELFGLGTASRMNGWW